ncbi:MULTISPECIES: pentapeptide repeat-containing protein [unclassified Bradyrhizobium]|uniref:pentapeptide repeat-containing protein n=1 Tax=unclassified Bradyrhizobium TaxID=2631580 RepID=UPI0029165FB4|nr:MULTISPECIES: pentapeptide repeat-containing protein [unclassified Bradyrhizobium]
MDNKKHVALLKRGTACWNAWRNKNPDVRPDLTEADLHDANLDGADLGGADLSDGDLSGANLGWANLSEANLRGTVLKEANLSHALLAKANLSQANFCDANLGRANVVGANLSGAELQRVSLWEADLSRADLSGANLSGANLSGATLKEAHLGQANLRGTNLTKADLSGADLREADLQRALLVETDLSDTDLTASRIYGTSAWSLRLERAKQQNLLITPENEPSVTVDNIEVAQFVYLLLHNEKVRDVIDTIGKKGVLLLGRFTEGRMDILERLREKLRSLGFVPMVFNFNKPATKDFTETVRLLCNLSHFVIVDITNPRSAPLELQATVPDYMVPFVPILERGQEPFAMFVDLHIKYDWVLEPAIAYSSSDRLIDVFEEKIVQPAEAKFNQLLTRRTQKLRIVEV